MMNNELRPYEEMKNSYQDWLAEVPNHWRLAKAKRIFRETSIKFLYPSLILSNIGEGFSFILAALFPPLNLLNTLGTIVIAAISDIAKAEIIVFANAPNIILVSPSVNNIGRNTQIIVKVEPIIALDTVVVP